MKPLCFVLMPFGIKTDGNNKEIDFDKVYNSFIRPAIIAAGLEPIRADEEKMGGFIHKPMYERLMFCEFAIADLSFANANVFYELGIRHALRPHTTVSIFEVGTKLPFDTAPLKTFPYDFESGEVRDLKPKIGSLAKLIESNKLAGKALNDSPIGQLIKGYEFPDLTHLEKDADSFADVARERNNVKLTLEKLVEQWGILEEEIRYRRRVNCEDQLAEQNQIVNAIDDELVGRETSLKSNFELLSAFLDSYKSVNNFPKIVQLLEPLKELPIYSIYLKQQLALAYNKTGQRLRSSKILTGIINQYGPDPETNGLLGAVYKGLMSDNDHNSGNAASYGNDAIDVYLEGFKSDPRDYYPGVNALTLLFTMGLEEDERYKKYFPLVSYAVERLEPAKKGDYWLQATGLELAVLERDKTKAEKYLRSALACFPEAWKRESTYGNLRRIYIRFIQIQPDNDFGWLEKILESIKPTE